MASDRLLDSERARRGDLTAPGGNGRFNNVSLRYRFDPDFRAFVFESPAAEIARQITRSRMLGLLDPVAEAIPDIDTARSRETLAPGKLKKQVPSQSCGESQADI